jgi:hypothetical protein
MPAFARSIPYTNVCYTVGAAIAADDKVAAKNPFKLGAGMSFPGGMLGNGMMGGGTMQSGLGAHLGT